MYKYSYVNELQNGTLRFRCTNKVILRDCNNLKNIYNLQHNHIGTHDPNTKRSSAVDIIRNSSKKNCAPLFA